MSSEKKEILRQFFDLSKIPAEAEFRNLERAALRVLSRTMELDSGKSCGSFTQRASSSQCDSLWELSGLVVGIEVCRPEVDAEIMTRVIGYVSTYVHFDHVLIFSPAGFTDEARDIATISAPVKVEMIEFNRL